MADFATDRASVAVPAIPAEYGEFADWVVPHLPVLSAIAVRQVGANDAQDVVQETLVRAWRRRATFDPGRGTARAWLVGILLDRARRHRTRSRPALVLTDEPAGTDQDARLDVERAVAALPPRQREVITLHYLADLRVEDVANVLGISESSVKTDLRAARDTLRTRLEQR